jgi:hypothetical protein
MTREDAMQILHPRRLGEDERANRDRFLAVLQAMDPAE